MITSKINPLKHKKYFAFIEVNWASLQFKGDFLPKFGSITNVKGLTNTNFSCSDWNMPLVTGWDVDRKTENMPVFLLPICVNNYWQVNNYVAPVSIYEAAPVINVDYLFISNKRYYRALVK